MSQRVVVASYSLIVCITGCSSTDTTDGPTRTTQPDNQETAMDDDEGATSQLPGGANTQAEPSEAAANNSGETEDSEVDTPGQEPPAATAGPSDAPPTSSEDGAGAPGGQSDGAAVAIPGVLLLDDAEDGDSVTLGEQSVGFWYSFDDSCECDNPGPRGETVPLPTPLGGPEFTATNYEAADAPPAPPEGAQVSNESGLRLSGGGHAWLGAGLGVGLNAQTGLLPLDLEALGVVALRFQVRNGTGPVSLQVRLTDDYSEAVGGQCVARPETDNRCSFPSGTECSAEGCFDSANQRIDVNQEWQVVEIPLSELQRDGWGSYLEGIDPPPGLNTQAVYQLQFTLLEASFDLWIDNVGFVR